MRHFTCVQDLGDLKQALNEAFEIKKDRFQFTLHIYKNLARTRRC